jgi:hypothetical protein
MEHVIYIYHGQKLKKAEAMTSGFHARKLLLIPSMHYINTISRTS